MSNEESVDGPDGGDPWPEGGPPTRGNGRDAGPAALLHLTGELDIAAAGLVRRQLLSHISTSEDPAVVVDLSQVTFMDCAGREPLLSADRWLVRRDRSLVLRSVSAQVEFLFASLRRAGLVSPFEQPEGLDLTEYADLNNDVADDPDLADDLDLMHLMDHAYAVEAARLRRAFEGSAADRSGDGFADGRA